MVSNTLMCCGLNFQLSDEQQLFIEKVLEGKTILVDTCIGSGKTTAFRIYVINCQGRKEFCI